jgi:glycosyltransferase involved in cell wall biosynthesis
VLIQRKRGTHAGPTVPLKPSAILCGMATGPLVSVIIPTRNSAKRLDACLRSVEIQTYSNVEVIVVDQSSTDATRDIAKQYGARVVSMPPPRFYSPPSKSRNVGAEVAEGQVLYHLDSDMELSPALISEIVDIFSARPEIGALIVHEVDRVLGYWSKCKAFERRCYWGNDLVESARIVRREIFQKVKGYDESISSGEDLDIQRSYKNVCEVGFCSNVVFHNLTDVTLVRILIKKYQYGKTATSYFSKHKQNSSFIRQELKSYLIHYRSFLRHPVIGVGVFAMRFGELLAGTTGLLSGKVGRFIHT